MLPDYSSLCGLFVGSDIISGGYALLKGDLGAYDPVSGAAVKSVVDDLCAANGITEDLLFKPFTEEYIQNVNNGGSVTLWQSLAPSTAYTLFAKATNSDGDTIYIAHTMSTKAEGALSRSVENYVTKRTLLKSFDISKLTLIEKDVTMQVIR